MSPREREYFRQDLAASPLSQARLEKQSTAPKMPVMGICEASFPSSAILGWRPQCQWKSRAQRTYGDIRTVTYLLKVGELSDDEEY